MEMNEESLVKAFMLAKLRSDRAIIVQLIKGANKYMSGYGFMEAQQEALKEVDRQIYSLLQQ